MKHMDKRILLVGPLPPPSGGVSVHIQRLSNVLKNDFEVDFIDEAKSVKKEYFNLRNMGLWGYFKKVKKADLIHIHSGASFLRIFHIMIGRLLRKKIVLTLHYYPIRKRKLLRFIDELFYQLAHKVIVVNSNIFQNISLPRNKCVVNNAFLPPVMEDEPELPSNVVNWINNAKKHQKIILCANAWRLDTFNKYDLYGLDMCIEITRRLLTEEFDVSFVFNVSTIDKSGELFQKYHALIEKLDLRDNFFLISEKLSFVRLIEHADIIIRPTNWDGDSLTVREALMLGKPILASDIVERPVGTALFKTRDISDLEIKLKQLLTLGSTANSSDGVGYKNGYADFYISLVEELLSEKSSKSDIPSKQFEKTTY
jgi:glycosyltransferase involved in cell wall biosynthesis